MSLRLATSYKNSRAKTLNRLFSMSSTTIFMAVAHAAWRHPETMKTALVDITRLFSTGASAIFIAVAHAAWRHPETMKTAFVDITLLFSPGAPAIFIAGTRRVHESLWQQTGPKSGYRNRDLTI